MQIRDPGRKKSDPGRKKSDPGWKKSDPGWKKFGSGIWDKHLGSATLQILSIFLKGWVRIKINYTKIDSLNLQNFIFDLSLIQNP
jgi:hypothetical protein